MTSLSMTWHVRTRRESSENINFFTSIFFFSVSFCLSLCRQRIFESQFLPFTLQGKPWKCPFYACCKGLFSEVFNSNLFQIEITARQKITLKDSVRLSPSVLSKAGAKTCGSSESNLFKFSSHILWMNCCSDFEFL